MRWRLSLQHEAAGSAQGVWEVCPVLCWRAHRCFSDLSELHTATDQGKLAPLALLCIDLLPGAGSSLPFGVEQHLCDASSPWEQSVLGLGSRVWAGKQIVLHAGGVGRKHLVTAADATLAAPVPHIGALAPSAGSCCSSPWVFHLGAINPEEKYPLPSNTTC